MSEEQFVEQGGAATMDPSSLVRWLTSKVMSAIIREGRVERAQNKAEKARASSGQTHKLEYFHQIDDAYGLLAVQCLQPLLQRYEIELQCHLVAGPSGDNLPEPDLLPALARNDAALVAPHYGLRFPQQSEEPTIEASQLGNSILAATAAEAFSERAIAVGIALFAGDTEALHALAEQHGVATSAETTAAVDAGSNRLRSLKHYSGAMFYYAGQWYWGVDRLYHLEKRWLDLRINKENSRELLYPRPPVVMGPKLDNGSLTLEIYASLRSPYTALIFDKAVELAHTTGIKLELCPVLPMVMRGVSLSRTKGMYIFSDAAREARALGAEFGKFYDPIGEPARRCYSLLVWAEAEEKRVALYSSFLKAAFAEGVNTNNDQGLRYVVEQAGLSWDDAQAAIDNDAWQSSLEENRKKMYSFGCWGVPSFRLLDANGQQVLGVWGQDRLWLVSREIQRLLT